LLQRDLLWKHGVFLRRKDTEAFLLEEPLKKRISVQICGRGDIRERLAWITEELDNIHSEYYQLEVKRKIPCRCMGCLKSEEPYFFDYARLMKAKSKGRETLECQESFEDVIISKLLIGFENSVDSKTRSVASSTYKRIAWPEIKRELRKILIKYYEKHKSMIRIAKDAGIPLRNVDIGGDINYVWNEVLEEGKKQGQIQVLLDLVVEEYPLSKKDLQRISEEWVD
ncbi:MAG: effector-associated domain EAD1-containing protein, partial [Bacteroidota bacterium]